jgi:hypothetical protein
MEKATIKKIAADMQVRLEQLETDHVQKLEELRKQKLSEKEAVELELQHQMENLRGQLSLLEAEGSSQNNELGGLEHEIKEQKQELEDNVESLQKLKSDIENEHKETERLKNLQAQID